MLFVFVFPANSLAIRNIIKTDTDGITHKKKNRIIENRIIGFFSLLAVFRLS